MRTTSSESAEKKETKKDNQTPGTHSIKTGSPLSEKDEVKQAEEKLRKPKRKLL